MHFVKCEIGPHKYFALFCTATKSLGNFGIHLNFSKMEMAFKVLFLHCFNALAQFIKIGDVVFLNIK